MVPDVVVNTAAPAAAEPLAADAGKAESGADNLPLFGEALRNACDSAAPATSSPARPGDARRSRADASSAAWWAFPPSIAAGCSAAPVVDAAAMSISQPLPDVPGDDATDAAPAEDEASSETDPAAALLAIGQPFAEVPDAQTALGAGTAPADSETPVTNGSCESGSEASAAQDVALESVPTAIPSRLPDPSVKVDSVQAREDTPTDRWAEPSQSHVTSEVDRPVEERLDADVQPAQPEEKQPSTAQRTGTLDLRSASSARQPTQATEGVAVPTATVVTEERMAVESSPTAPSPEAGRQTPPLTAAEQDAESLQGVSRESAPTTGPAGQSLPLESPGGGSSEGQAEHGRSQHEQREQLWKPFVSPHGPAGRTAALLAPGLTLLQGPDGVLTLMPATAAAPAQPPSIPAENLEQFVQTMRVMVRGNVSEATVRLRPEHLGEVSVAVRVDGRVVTATVTAESAGVCEWLLLHEEALRTGLQQQGLTLDRLVVQRETRQERREPHPGARRSRPRRGQDPQPRFEVSA